MRPSPSVLTSFGALAVAAVDALMGEGADPAILGPLAAPAGSSPDGTGPGDFGQLLTR